MKNVRLLNVMVAIAVIAGVSLSSCESFGTNEEADVVGTWTIDGVTVDVTANGKDILDVMIDDFGFEQADAETQLDSLTIEIEDDMNGTVTFADDNTYTVNMSDDSPENGTWSLSEDGNSLTLVDEDMSTDLLTINKLNSSTMILALPDEDEDIDLDGDDEEETTMIISIEMTLSKN